MQRNLLGSHWQWYTPALHAVFFFFFLFCDLYNIFLWLPIFEIDISISCSHSQSSFCVCESLLQLSRLLASKSITTHNLTESFLAERCSQATLSDYLNLRKFPHGNFNSTSRFLHHSKQEHSLLVALHSDASSIISFHKRSTVANSPVSPRKKHSRET